MAKFEVNYEEKIKQGKFDNFQLLKLDEDGKINLQHLRLAGILSEERLEELNKLRLHMSLMDRNLSFEEKWQMIEENELDVEELRRLSIINKAEYDQMKPLPLEVDQRNAGGESTEVKTKTKTKQVTAKVKTKKN